MAEQGDRESRRLWRHVTAALFHEKINLASSAKRWIEDRQRTEAKKRHETGQKWASQFFDCIDGTWVYKQALGRTER